MKKLNFKITNESKVKKPKHKIKTQINTNRFRKPKE